MSRLARGKAIRIRMVFCYETRDPTRWTSRIPKAWATEMVVRNAPLFFGLVYSPRRTERRGSISPKDMP